jgi:siroheme synthase (precorrin-2 oxidase/ferrochelatase)
LQIYLDKNRQVVVIGSGATVSAQIKESASTNDTYFVANKSRYPETSWQGVELIKQYPKAFSPGQTQDVMLFFKVTPNESTSSSSQVNK